MWRLKMTKKTKKGKPKFDLEQALKSVHPFMLEGFRWFICDKKIESQEEFDKLYKQYGGGLDND